MYTQTSQTEKAEKADKGKGDSGLVVSVAHLWTKLRGCMVWQIGKANKKLGLRKKKVSLRRKKYSIPPSFTVA